MKPLLAVTMGDPCGIGPEIILKASRSSRWARRYRPVIFGDAAYLSAVHNKLKSKIGGVDFYSLPYARLGELDRSSDFRRRRLCVADFQNVGRRPSFGSATAWGGRASGQYIAAAVDACRHHLVQGMVTLPINKVSFRLGGWGKEFIGHTEMIAALTGTKKFALMLARARLKAVHVTQHMALRDVPKNISVAKVSEAIALADLGLRLLGIRRPKIAVSGLNPHAGDNGLMGNEEKKIIAPSVNLMKRRGLDVVGPLSSDALWPQVAAGKFDVGVAMYHDQGQIAVKLAGLDGGVNVTLGIPIVRTSVMHGTAYDIAGSGQASPESLLDALDLAAQMAANKGDAQ